jgi:hypothetical protein
MKMDGYQNKGVAGRAFCKHMKIKRMDGRNLGLAGVGDVPQMHLRHQESSSIPAERPHIGSGCKNRTAARVSFDIHGRG